MGRIAEEFNHIQDSIPNEVKLVVATKNRTMDEVKEVIDAGADVIGENYTHPEAVRKYRELGDYADKVNWELIGHLQKNDINKALPIFDRIQTVESIAKAKHIDKRVEKAGKEVIPILIEINSGREGAKYGLPPEEEELEEMVAGIRELDHIRLEGLMTMGPFTGDPEDARPYFQITKKLFEYEKKLVNGKDRMEVLSMGMTNSYKVAIEEGANMIRVGTAIFGERS